MEYDVFMSYARADIEEMLAIKQAIERKATGIRIWFDIDGIESGDKFAHKIIKAIDKSKCVLFALSPNSINSPWTEREVMYASSKGKKVVPILLRGAKLDGWFLFQFGCIDCIDSTNSLQMDKLARDLSHWASIPIEGQLPDEDSIVASEAEPEGTVRKYTVGGVSFEMVKVSGGTFTMGASSSDSEAHDWEKPAHLVTLSPYWIGRTEVTQALWKAVMGSNPSYFKGDDLPVEQVSWEDCKAFVGKLGELTGARFALPTEAEWEYAARGGSRSKGCKYSGSDKIGEVAWYGGNSGGKTHPVGQKAANELGLYDMSGNVWEWCADWYGDYPSSAQTNPTGPSSASNRVFRGGSWRFGAQFCRVSGRYNNSPSIRCGDLGLRLSIREQ